MTHRPDILALCGSIRTGSLNRVLLNCAVNYLDAKGLRVELAELQQFELPLYNDDIYKKSGVPANAIKLRDEVLACRGVLICTPEYNGSMTPLVKNMIDWTSRPFEKNGPAKIFQRKIVCLAGATQGDKGALRGLSHLASVFLNMGSIVVPQFYGLSHAEAAFDESGNIKDAKIRSTFQTYLDSFVHLVNKW